MSGRTAEVLPDPRPSSRDGAGDRLQYGLDVSGTGIIDHDLVADTVYCSPRVFAIYGWPESFTASVQTFIDHAHPDEREPLRTGIQAAHDPAGTGHYEQIGRAHV